MAIKSRNAKSINGASKPDTYVDLDGRVYMLSTLDSNELKLIKRLRRFVAAHDDWYKYANYWMPEVDKFYSAKGLTRRQIFQTVGWQIAQDLSGRLMIAK